MGPYKRFLELERKDYARLREKRRACGLRSVNDSDSEARTPEADSADARHAGYENAKPDSSSDEQMSCQDASCCAHRHHRHQEEPKKLAAHQIALEQAIAANSPYELVPLNEPDYDIKHGLPSRRPVNKYENLPCGSSGGDPAKENKHRDKSKHSQKKKKKDKSPNYIVMPTQDEGVHGFGPARFSASNQTIGLEAESTVNMSEGGGDSDDSEEGEDTSVRVRKRLAQLRPVAMKYVVERPVDSQLKHYLGELEPKEAEQRVTHRGCFRLYHRLPGGHPASYDDLPAAICLWLVYCTSEKTHRHFEIRRRQLRSDALDEERSSLQFYVHVPGETNVVYFDTLNGLVYYYSKYARVKRCSTSGVDVFRWWLADDPKKGV